MSDDDTYCPACDAWTLATCHDCRDNHCTDLNCEAMPQPCRDEELRFERADEERAHAKERHL